jgi:hypothetical protein
MDRDFSVVLRHLGLEKEIVVLKTAQETRGTNFYAFPPYAKEPLGSFDTHMSYHASGQRHCEAKMLIGSEWRREAAIYGPSVVQLRRQSELTGVVELYHSGVFVPWLSEFPRVGTNRGQIVLLDGTAAGFRADFICVWVYVVAPGAEGQIPTHPDTGPRILQAIEDTWIVVDVFQQVGSQN